MAAKSLPASAPSASVGDGKGRSHSRLSPRRVGTARPPRRDASPRAAGTDRRFARRLWLDRALGGAARLRQPRADEFRHRRRRYAPRRRRNPDAAAGSGARSCDGIFDGRRRRARPQRQAGERGRIARARFARAHRRFADEHRRALGYARSDEARRWRLCGDCRGDHVGPRPPVASTRQGGRRRDAMGYSR
jgi:hypothetical protein